MSARSLSWPLIIIGLLLTGSGVYYYYTATVAQREAAHEWNNSEAVPEEPVPQKLPLQRLPYYDPYRLGDTVAKLTIPRLDKTLFVVEGTDQKDLKKGPGHMPGTALPGVAGNCVIAGHRDTHFRPLEDIRKGDIVELDTKYGTFRYQVRSMDVVSPTDVSSLYPTDNAVLHLVTCYPFHYIGHAPKRMVIEASLESNPRRLSENRVGVEEDTP